MYVTDIQLIFQHNIIHEQGPHHELRCELIVTYDMDK